MLNHSGSLNAVFHALADPTRRLLIERLSQGPASVKELAKPLRMTLPGVLQHLTLLQRSGLVQTKKIGRVRTCRIHPAALRHAETWIMKRRAVWERKLDRLAVYLAETRPRS